MIEVNLENNKESNNHSENISMHENKKEEDIIKQRKEKIIRFLKEKGMLKTKNISFVCLLAIIILNVIIRTSNISKLKDVTTGNWTLGPDLDPFLFLRMAKEIVAKGYLPAVDMMRYYPLGFDSAGETKLLPYSIAYLYKFLKIFVPGISIEYAAIIYPVIFSVLMLIAFFLLVQKLFEYKGEIFSNSIAIISTLLLAVAPSVLHRTVAGIPEKEAPGLFFIFLSFYFIITAWKSKDNQRALIFGILAGISTWLLGMVWGGVVIVFNVIAFWTILCFILGKVDKKEAIAYFSWCLLSVILLVLFGGSKFKISILLFSFETIIIFFVFVVILFDIIFKKKIELILEKKNVKIPASIISISFILIIGIIAILIIKPEFLIEVYNKFLHPLGTKRFTLTVAENKEPYFDEWKNSFGPIFLKIPLIFTMFFIGVIWLFYDSVKNIKKKNLLTFLFALSLFGLIFSRISPTSVFNGESFLSKLFYFGSIALFGLFCVFVFIKNYSKEKENFTGIEPNNLFVIGWFFIMIILMRGAVRFTMILNPISIILASFFVVNITEKAIKKNKEILKIFALISIVLLAFTVYTNYNVISTYAKNEAPSHYTVQWQKAMAWVRENTPPGSVFSHWWDYGYWVQSIGERPTFLDGGNAIIYWDHLFGRHVLTGQNNIEALELLKVHNTSYLLIDSTDIGKYSAYSSIGADENYDRLSWVGTFIRDEFQTNERREEVRYAYIGGWPLDEDIRWFDYKTKKEIILTSGSSYIFGIVIPFVQQNQTIIEMKQPVAIAVSSGTRYELPMKYAYIEGKEVDFGSGVEMMAYIYPRVISKNDGIIMDKFGSVMLLSRRAINALWVKLYLLNEEIEGFELVHSEPDVILEILRQRGLNVGEIAYFYNTQGPIKIWKINYPENITFREEYLLTSYPDPRLEFSKW